MTETIVSYESARERLQKLGPLAEQLNAATDAATEKLKAIEAELQGMAIGLEINHDAILTQRVLRDSEWQAEWLDQGAVHEFTYLGYGRDGAQWRLLVRRRHEQRNGEGEWETLAEQAFPLVGASRDLRLAAWDHLDSFLDEIAEEMERKLKSLHKAVAKR